jgi:outer membrane protein
MKKFALLIILAAGLISSAHAQTKVAFADPDYILSQMPEYKTIENELKNYQTQLRTNIDKVNQEFQKKYKEYMDNQNTMIDAVKASTERDLAALQDNLQKMQQEAQTSMQNKQFQLLDPVNQKIGKAISDVAKENGYNMVLNARSGGFDVVLYGDDSIDLSDLVLKKMGVTPKPVAATPGSTTTPKQ